MQFGVASQRAAVLKVCPKRFGNSPVLGGVDAEGSFDGPVGAWVRPISGAHFEFSDVGGLMAAKHNLEDVSLPKRNNPRSRARSVRHACPGRFCSPSACDGLVSSGKQACINRNHRCSTREA